VKAPAFKRGDETAQDLKPRANSITLVLMKLNGALIYYAKAKNSNMPKECQEL